MSTYRYLLTLASAALLLVTLACGEPPVPSETSAPPPASPAETPTAGAASGAPSDEAADDEKAPTVAFLGDSLTAGLGLGENEAFPALLGERLEAEGLPVRVVNAGISGDTTAGGLRRLDWLLEQRPDVLVVGLGGNDGLRALDTAGVEDNLRQILAKAREADAEVLLLGMKFPPNYGPEYVEELAAIYPRLAEEHDVDLVPFMLEGVAGIPELNQADGIHPNAEGQRRIAELILPHLRPIVAEAQAATERKREISEATSSGEL